MAINFRATFIYTANELENTNVMNLYNKYVRFEVTPPQEDTSTHSAMAREWYEWGCDFLDSKSYSDALKYFRLAANENYAPAQDKLGWMYQNGWE